MRESLESGQRMIVWEVTQGAYLEEDAMSDLVMIWILWDKY